MGGYLVVMCDYGLDDAIATCRLFENYDLFNKIDILAVGGNVSPEVSLRNAKTLSSMFKLDERVTLVDTCTIPQPHENLFDIHGADGMGNILTPTESLLASVDFNDWLSGYNGCDVLLSLGPMTVTEMIIKKARPQEFIFMAGNISAKPNYNGYEFNEGINPKAFSYCCSYPHKAVTLDIGTAALDVIDKKIDASTLKDRLSAKYRDLSKERGEKHCYIWDDIAVRYLLSPPEFIEKKCVDNHGNVLNCLMYRGS